MMKNIYKISIAALTLCFAPSVVTEASAMIEMNEMETSPIKLELRGNSLVVSGAAGKVLRIMNIVGNNVMTVRIESNEKVIDISSLAKTVILVKVGNESKKLNLGK